MQAQVEAASTEFKCRICKESGRVALRFGETHPHNELRCAEVKQENYRDMLARLSEYRMNRDHWDDKIDTLERHIEDAKEALEELGIAVPEV